MTTPLEKGLLFSAPMVRALLDGSKTNSRRLVKLPDADSFPWELVHCDGNGAQFDGPRVTHYAKCPHPIGSRIYAKETFRTLYDPATCLEGARDIDYKADGRERIMDKIGKSKWKSALFMPKWAARIWLEVTAVRVERLGDISEEDAKKEGISVGPVRLWKNAVPSEHPGAKRQFEILWNSIHGPGAWERDKGLWTWLYEFRRIKL